MYSANFVLKKQNVPIQKRKTKKTNNWLKVKKKSFSISKYLEKFFCFCISNKNETKQRFFFQRGKKTSCSITKKRNIDIPSHYGVVVKCFASGQCGPGPIPGQCRSWRRCLQFSKILHYKNVSMKWRIAIKKCDIEKYCIEEMSQWRNIA